MAEIDKSNYNFLQDSPKAIIESLYEELQGLTLNQMISTSECFIQMRPQTKSRKQL